MAASDWTFEIRELGDNLEQAKGALDGLLFYAKFVHEEYWHLLEMKSAEQCMEKLGILNGLIATVDRLSLFGHRSVYLTYPTSKNQQEDASEVIYSYLEKVGIYWNRWDVRRDRGYVQVEKIVPPRVPTGYIPPQWRGVIAAAMVLWEREIVKVLKHNRRLSVEDWEIEAEDRNPDAPANWTPCMMLPPSVIDSDRVAVPGAFPSYFPWAWRLNGRNLAGEEGLFGSPNFMLPRYDISFSEMTESGYELISWNPGTMVAIRRLEGVFWREKVQCISVLKSSGYLDALKYAEEVDREGLTGWVVPRVRGNFFQGKSFDGIEFGPPDEIRRTATLMTPEPVAARLESMFG